jgi:hypothetical protein
MTAFVMRLPSSLPVEAQEKLYAWCKTKCSESRFRRVAEEALYGGVFHEDSEPRDLKSLQRLMVTNLKNWDVDRRGQRYKRGWLQLVDPEEYFLQLTTPEERAALEQKHKDELAAKEAAEAEKKRQERLARVARGAKILQRLADRRLQGAVDKLAAEIKQRRADEAAAREAKQSAFNEQRYGLPGTYVNYDDAEMECEDWAAVKRRRLEHPQPDWKEKQDARLARGARDRKLSARYEESKREIAERAAMAAQDQPA